MTVALTTTRSSKELKRIRKIRDVLSLAWRDEISQREACLRLTVPYVTWKDWVRHGYVGDEIELVARTEGIAYQTAIAEAVSLIAASQVERVQGMIGIARSGNVKERDRIRANVYLDLFMKLHRPAGPIAGDGSEKRFLASFEPRRGQATVRVTADGSIEATVDVAPTVIEGTIKTESPRPSSGRGSSNIQ